MITSHDNKIENLLGSRAKIKILKTLATNNELSITQIIRNTNLNHTSAMSHLDHLKSLVLSQARHE